ncbi:LAME_0G02938g1_1 [Lachancea meyersii CBS 8951]|uniref:LAME_0G02938g1_1 n=1 Tax=Lachancea meyersii CBS 8951 TaxID=1266667 RepID=A0A1G4K6B7_9SACH|nr:LAME_0G02938g1_1 [Lachancea meyersii CBS 8951]
MSAQEDKLTNSLEALARVEDDIDVVEKEVEIIRLRKMAPLYELRGKAITGVDGFWKVVLSQHSDFANYVRAADLKYIDCIKSIEMKWMCLEDNKLDHRNVAISFEFDGIDGDFEAQIVTKYFKIENDITKFKYTGKRTEEDDLRDGELGFLTSEPCQIKWPKSFNNINPSLVSDKSTAEGKKNYRTGMKSFFSWFKWTGLKVGKEFPNGDGLANLLADDIYPNCTKYYTEAQVDLEDENIDDEDLSNGPIELESSGSGSDENPKNEPEHKKRKI